MIDEITQRYNAKDYSLELNDSKLKIFHDWSRFGISNNGSQQIKHHDFFL